MYDQVDVKGTEKSTHCSVLVIFPDEVIFGWYKSQKRLKGVVVRLDGCTKNVLRCHGHIVFNVRASLFM